ncbi:DUF1775 domain-containing protein [Nakamurella sp. YIM 132087]|uniref:DUF1775 domain-containing protein n=1 Tax=Nakamurella alba TaxID=2665158 RepID=A0A7K1FNH8_9ACTN|nr:DUF1775 domain-containing protein [Nakamurella alba]
MARRAGVLTLLTGLGLLIGAGAASAHVTVNPGTATAGSYSKLTFRVPNESATASTVQVTVDFPTDHPFASVSVKKEPGWTATVTRSTLDTPVTQGNTTITEAVTSITWKADADGQISLGEFAEFDVSVGPVPDVESISFPAAQTYSDGTVVDWDEPTPASGEEPEHPAPTLTVVQADGDGDAGHSHGADTSTAPATDSTATVSAAAEHGDTDSAARVLAVIGIVVGAGGLLVGAIGIRRGRSAR